MNVRDSGMRVKDKVKYINGEKYILCRTCKEYKRQTEFYKRKNREHDSDCKSCHRRMSKDYYHKVGYKKHARSKISEYSADDIIVVKKSEVSNDIINKIIQNNKLLRNTK